MAATPAVSPTPAPAPARPAAEARAAGPSEHRFGDRLDAARRARHERHGNADERDGAAAGDGKGQPRAAAAGAGAQPAKAASRVDEGDRHDADPAAGTLAAAMLGLIGHAVPAGPGGTHAAAVRAGAGQAGHLPSTNALVAVAGTGASPADVAADAPLAAPGLAAGASPVAAPAFAAALTALSGADARRRDPADALPALAGQAATPAAMAPLAADAHRLSLGSPPGTPAFGNELGQQIAWLGQQEVKQARIRLHPEELGPLDVSVRMDHNRVDVSFAVQHPGTVHALQQTLPQLDALLAQHGLALGQADVGQRGQPGQQGAPATTGGEPGEGDGAVAATSIAARPLALGLLDTFA